MKFLRLPELCSRVGLSRATIYTMIRAGRFPAPIKIGTRASAWSSKEIDEWQAGRLAARKAA